jgi:hypothetical protein
MCKSTEVKIETSMILMEDTKGPINSIEKWDVESITTHVLIMFDYPCKSKGIGIFKFMWNSTDENHADISKKRVRKYLYEKR